MEVALKPNKRAACLLPVLLTSVLQFAVGQLPEDQFRSYLFIESGLSRDHAALKKALDQFQIVGVNFEAGEDVGPLRALGRPFYIDQLVGEGILHIRSEEFFKSLGDDHLEHGAARPKCLRDPAILGRARELITRHLQSLEGLRPDFISLRDEPSATRLLNPADYCVCAECRKLFHRFVVKRWGSEEKARAAFGLTPAENAPLNPEPLGPMPTTVARRRLFFGRRTPEALVAWNDARTFADLAFAEALETLVEHTKTEFRETPVGILGCQMPSAFGGFHWERLCRSLSAIEAYDFGAASAIVHSFRGPSTPVLHTYFRRDGPPEALAHELYRHALRGDRLAVFYSSREAFVDHDPTRPTEWLQSLAKPLGTIQSEALREWHGARKTGAHVAIVLSMESIRLHWMLDSREDGTSWPRRLTSHETMASSEAQNRRSLSALFEDLGYTVTFVSPEQVRTQRLRSQGVNILVLPRLLAVDVATAEAVTEFAKAGGLVFADGLSAWFSESLREHARPLLDAFFGIDHPRKDLESCVLGVDSSPQLLYPVAEPSLKVTSGRAERRANSIPAVIVRGSTERDSEIRSLYLNLQIQSYAKDRVHSPDKAQWLRRLVAKSLVSGAQRPPFRMDAVEEGGGWPIVAHWRRGEKGLYLAVMADGGPEDLARPSDPRAWKERDVTIHLEKVTEIQDLETGESLGHGTSIRTSVGPARPRWFRLTP